MLTRILTISLVVLTMFNFFTPSAKAYSLNAKSGFLCAPYIMEYLSHNDNKEIGTQLIIAIKSGTVGEIIAHFLNR